VKDYEEKVFKTKEEMEKFLKERDDADQWLRVPMCNIKVSGDYGPIIVHSVLDSFDGTYEGTEEDAMQCLEEAGLFVGFSDPSDEGRIKTYPLRYTAVDSLYDRAGLSGRTIHGEGDSDNILHPSVKAEWLTTALNLYKKSETQILIREGKISTMRSAQYNVLKASELFDNVWKFISRNWDEPAFIGGVASHELTHSDISYGSEDENKILKSKLTKAGIKCEKCSLSLQFYTSDTGDAAATLLPYIRLDDKLVPIGEGLKLVHSHGASMDDWREKILKRLDSFPRATLEKIDNLASIKIDNPAGCLRFTACDLKLPKRNSLKVAADFEAMYTNGCTALDVYYKLFEIAQMSQRKTEADKLKANELIARSLFTDFKANDLEFEWADNK